VNLGHLPQRVILLEFRVLIGYFSGRLEVRCKKRDSVGYQPIDSGCFVSLFCRPAKSDSIDNKTCIRRWGFCAVFMHFLRSGLFLNERFYRPPTQMQVTQTGSMGVNFYDKLCKDGRDDSYGNHPGHRL